MAFTVEFTITRPNTETDWPWETVSGPTGLASLREQYNATSSESVSADGLVWTVLETCPAANVDEYFASFRSIWENIGVNSNAVDNNVTISSRVVQAD